MHTSIRSRRGRDERGAAAVEFALVLPLLIAFLFGIISFGFLFAQDLALGNAARQTARYGVVETRTCGEIVAEAISAASPLVTIDASQVHIKRGQTEASTTAVCAGGGTDKPCEGSHDKDNLYVRLDFGATMLLPLPGIDSDVALDGSGVFRCEWS